MTPGAIVFAAGLGTRMRPLTEHLAKPLLRLGGATLLDHALDRLAAAGVAQAVVNAHWQADGLAEHLAARRGLPATVVRREATLLGSWGSVRAALAEGRLGPAPFYTVNGDSFWLDGPAPALLRLASAFDAAHVDAVLLVHRTFQVHGDLGPGDFFLDRWGVPRRRGEQEIAPYVYAGVQLIAPAAWSLHTGDDGADRAGAGMNALWDRLIAAGRLSAVVHDGLWFHLSRPSDLDEAELALVAQDTGETT